MKCKFTPSINYWSGKSDDFVYAPSPNRQYSILRQFKYPTITTQNTLMGSIMQNLANVWLTAHSLYKADFKTYTTRYLAEFDNLGETPYPCHSSYGFFVKMMFAWRASDPETVDLENVTVADIIALDADVKSVDLAILAGFLPSISVYDDLDALIQVTP